MFKTPEKQMRIGLLSLFFFLGCVFAHAQNLIPDPGFESGLGPWGVYTNGPSFITTQIDNTISHTGASSIKIQINHDTASQTGVIYQAFQLKKGAHYLFDCFVKTDSVVNGGAAQYCILYLHGQRLYGEGGYGVSGTTAGWEEQSYRFYMPQGCDTLQLMVALGATNGTAWFDDISLTELTDTSYHPLSVTLNAFTGTTINPFTSTNVGPIDPSVSSLDLSSRFREVGMDFVRTHDFEGPCDMHLIFADTSRSALDSSAYNFALTDSVIKGIVNAGSKVYFRLGESGTNNRAYYNPPNDYMKWATVCGQIMKHYNMGWDKGFHYGIKYWEIYNEPDLGWNGTVNDFIKLYRLSSQVLKSEDTSLRIGGPAIAGLSSTSFLYTFLDSVHTENLPFDFFSYHYYHTFNPYDFFRSDQLAKQILNTYGLGNKERIVSEWSNYNYNPGNNYYVWRNDPFMAASAIASLTYYQNTDVFKLLRYRTDGTDLGMFDASGNYNFTGLAYYYMSQFRTVPRRLQASGGDTLGFSILAGKSLNDSVSGVLVADNSSSAHGYTLTVNGMTASEQENYYIFRIDSNIISKAVDSGAVSLVNNKITVAVKPPFVDLVVLFKSVVTAVPEVPLSGHISAFPNPFSGNVVIHYQINEEQMEMIFITDLQGKTIRTFGKSDLRTDSAVVWDGKNDAGQTAAKGIYLLKIQTSGNVYTQKLISTY